MMYWKLCLILKLVNLLELMVLFQKCWNTHYLTLCPSWLKCSIEYLIQVVFLPPGRSILLSRYKYGNAQNPDNYRGISLTSILGKTFTSIINSRLTQWSNMRDLIPESQAGFRKDYSTFDHIFTLYAVIERYLSFSKQKLYVL